MAQETFPPEFDQGVAQRPGQMVEEMNVAIDIPVKGQGGQMQRIPLDSDEGVSMLLDSETVFPVILDPRNDDHDSTRLTEEQARQLYSVLKDRYQNDVGEEGETTGSGQVPFLARGRGGNEGKYQ
jgi:hypothetical protein